MEDETTTEEPAKVVRRSKVRQAETYRHARRNGWRWLNKQLAREGRDPVSWITFNQDNYKYRIGARPALYVGGVKRTRSWHNAFHLGEKNRRFKQETKRGLHAAVV